MLGSPLAALVGLVLVAHRAERERVGNRLERHLRDRNADHDAACPVNGLLGKTTYLTTVRLLINVGSGEFRGCVEDFNTL